MSASDRPIIAGAGPVGLGAALFLTRQGIPVRVIEPRLETSTHSKALAVNPRTLDLLESTGLTRKLLAVGKPARGVQFHRHGRVLAMADLAGIHPRYPFLLALSQSATERLLLEALIEAGGSVEREIRVTGCRNTNDGVEVELGSEISGGRNETVTCPWLLAADGAHSTIRHALGIAFEGSTLAHEWYLADAPLRTTLPEDRAHILFFDRDGGGFVFLFHVIDPALKGLSEDPIWRIMSSRPDPLAHVQHGEVTGPPIWSSSFHVGHRINATLATGHVYFAGDAAHIHSPVGARGMNLGLEDAWVFAQLASRGQLSRYSALRRPVDRSVVKRVEAISRLAADEIPGSRLLKSFALPTAFAIPWVRRQMVRTVSGLDHPLPEFAKPMTPSPHADQIHEQSSMHINNP